MTAEAMTGVPGGVHHVAVAVRNLAVCEAFYASVLGLPVLRRWPTADGTEGIARSGWTSAAARSWRWSGPSASGDAPAGPRVEVTDGYLMIALRIARTARADWEARLSAAGVAVVHRTAYTLYVADPEGNRVGLSHWPEAAQPERS